MSGNKNKNAGPARYRGARHSYKQMQKHYYLLPETEEERNKRENKELDWMLYQQVLQVKFSNKRGFISELKLKSKQYPAINNFLSRGFI
jgi:hypothetical protein